MWLRRLCRAVLVLAAALPAIARAADTTENVLAQFPGGSSRIEDYVDTSLLAELKQDGFFAAAARKYGAQ